MFVALNEYGMERPIKILARADARHFQSFERVEHGAGSDRDSGSAQRAGEIDDILGEAAGCFL
jgi:hypothetical protein